MDCPRCGGELAPLKTPAGMPWEPEPSDFQGMLHCEKCEIRRGPHGAFFELVRLINGGVRLVREVAK